MALGHGDGSTVGLKDGTVVGIYEGGIVGIKDGNIVGMAEGNAEGVHVVGRTVGALVGVNVGHAVVAVGVDDGKSVCVATLHSTRVLLSSVGSYDRSVRSLSINTSVQRSSR